MNNIGLIIKNRRIELGLTQEELAKRCGYKDKSTIAKIEKGVNDINQTKTAKIAEALGVDPAYLYGIKPEEKKVEKSSLDMSELINFIMDDSAELTYNGKELTAEQRAAAKSALSLFKQIIDAK